VSGMMIPPLVFSSSSTRFTMIRSCKGLIFIFYLSFLHYGSSTFADKNEKKKSSFPFFFYFLWILYGTRLLKSLMFLTG